MTNQDTLTLAATIRDEAKRLENQHLGQSGFTTHTMRCQSLYLKLCAQASASTRDTRVTAAALQVVEVLGETDVGQIRMPTHLALALLNLQNAVKGTAVRVGPDDTSTYADPNGPDGIHARAALGVALELVKQEQAFANTLAKKCEELEAENKKLELRLAEELGEA